MVIRVIRVIRIIGVIRVIRLLGLVGKGHQCYYSNLCPLSLNQAVSSCGRGQGCTLETTSYSINSFIPCGLKSRGMIRTAVEEEEVVGWAGEVPEPEYRRFIKCCLKPLFS